LADKGFLSNDREYKAQRKECGVCTSKEKIRREENKGDGKGKGDQSDKIPMSSTGGKPGGGDAHTG